MALKNVTGSTASPVTAGRTSEAGVAKTGKPVADPVGTGLPKPSNASDKRGVDVNVSDRARTRAAEQKKAVDLAMKSPEVREDRVAALKAQIDAGTYKVDSGKIADGMMREAIMDHLTTEKNN